jgi:small nuclear ribonucleoprotein (snRNP)-like protein
MFRKTTHVLTVLSVVFGMLAAATPAFASSSGSELKGIIASVDTSANTVTIAPKDGSANVTVNVDTSTKIKRNGKSASIADLLVGDKAEVKYNPSTMLASKIEASINWTELKGVIAAVDTTANTVTITPSKGGANVTLNVDASTKIKRNGKSAALAELQVSDKVESKYNGATLLASKIEAKTNTAELKGVIAAVDTTASTVTITPSKGGADVTLTVDASTLIKRNGKSAALADLLVGDKVEAKYNPVTMLASKIEVKSSYSELKGKIAAVDTTANTVTITPSKGGADVTLNVDSSTIIKKNDVTITLADLVVGDMVEAKYSPATMLAAKIEVELPELKGTISAVDTSANTITVTPKGGGADVTFNVDASTVIKRHDAIVTLADLVVGDHVEVKYDAATMLAFKIEAE